MKVQRLNAILYCEVQPVSKASCDSLQPLPEFRHAFNPAENCSLLPSSATPLVYCNGYAYADGNSSRFSPFSPPVRKEFATPEWPLPNSTLSHAVAAPLPYMTGFNAWNVNAQSYAFDSHRKHLPNGMNLGESGLMESTPFIDPSSMPAWNHLGKLSQLLKHPSNIHPLHVSFSTQPCSTGNWEYQIIEQGSFGKVFAGSCQGKEVAIKVPVESMLQMDPQGVMERILNEWKILSKCDHPNIVKLVGGVVHGAFDVWLVTELVKGYDLHSIKYSQDPSIQRKISPRHGLHMCRQLAMAVAYLHSTSRPNSISIANGMERSHVQNLAASRQEGSNISSSSHASLSTGQSMHVNGNSTGQTLKEVPHQVKNKIIHRDIKPENVIVSKDWHISLCDFGDAEESENGSVTRLMGATWFYAPAELLACDPLGSAKEGLHTLPTFTEKWDIWSMGCVFHEMFGLSNPLHAYIDRESEASTYEKLKNHAQQGTLIPKISHRLQGICGEIISKCLQIDPNDRPTADEIVQMLNQPDGMILKDILIYS
ncbi:protein kinase [Cardiosporidium cionae]|uniref:Protein kinase n=1 Tax=Cardiosporidium cionae TaxID=476202 RepID=A0ABQ7JA74_9APIC|nr:protein kinase [Cardiosporidium cionae]|eukprot:KAF8820884.1 protein kinase [Cardiosporidium cionae]